MSTDFRARSIRVNQVINSGSTSTSPLLIYGLGSATDTAGGYTAAHFAGAGSDVWMFVSGTVGGAGLAGSAGAVAFKGDVVVSGALQIGELSSAPGTPASDKGAIYARTGTLYFKNDGGTEYNLTTGGGGASVAGSNTFVQFNADGVLGATSGLTFTTSSNRLAVSGDLVVDGGDITTSATTFNFVNTVVTTLNIGGASTNTTIGSAAGKVIIPGDLQIQGTTTTVSSSNLTVRDSLIGLGYLSGTVAESSTGDRGFIGGFTGANSNVAFVWSNNSSSFIAGKTGNLPNSSSIYIANYQPIRASSFQVNGTTAVITSSDGSTLTLSGTAVVMNASGSGRVKFQEDGSDYIEFSKQDGYSAQIRAIEALYPSLYLSGNSVYIDSYTGTSWFNSNSSGGLAVDTSTPTHPKIFSKEGSGTSRELTVSGSTLNLGSSNGLIKLLRGASTYLQATYNNINDVVVSAQSYNVNFGSTASTAISGSTVVLNHGAGVINFQRHGLTFATLSSGSGDIASLVASTGKQFYIGGTGLTKLSGSLLSISAGSQGVGIERDNSQFLTLASGSGDSASISAYSGKSLEIVSNSRVMISGSSVQITGSLISQTITGSIQRTVGGLDFIVGSGVTANYNSSGQWELTASGGGGTPAGSNTQVQFNADGVFAATSGLTFATGSSSLTVSGDLAVNGGDITSTQSSATIFATNVSSLAIGGAASSISLGNSSNANGFTLNVAASRTGSININLATGATETGLTKNINIGQGGDPGSTTNIKLGTTDTSATTNIYVSGSSYVTGSVSIKGSIIPDENRVYTLGTDTLRWAHVYTGDLHLRNERGDWTVIEEVDFLRIVNNKTGKNFKMMMQPLDD